MTPHLPLFLQVRRRRSAAVLVVGAIATVALVQSGVLSFFWTPTIVGLSYLAAAAAAGRTGALWAPGLITTCWGITVLLGVHQVVPGDKRSYLLAGAVGIALALLLRRTLGLAAGYLGMAVSFAAIAVYDNAYVPSWVFHGTTFAVVLGVWGLWDLRPQRPEPAAKAPDPSGQL